MTIFVEAYSSTFYWMLLQYSIYFKIVKFNTHMYCIIKDPSFSKWKQSVIVPKECKLISCITLSLSLVCLWTIPVFAVVKMVRHCAVHLVWEWYFCCGFRMQELFRYCPEFSTGREESVLQASLDLRRQLVLENNSETETQCRLMSMGKIMTG
jgi:hypothetical protein